jgi:hypothetical protein
MSSSTVTMAQLTESSTHSVEAAQVELAMVWEAHMKNSQSFFRYQKVAVLMFYWENSDLDKTNLLKQEVSLHIVPCWNSANQHLKVEELAAVFREEYKFEVQIELLHRPKPQLLLKKIIIDFLIKYDDPDALLIIYYAGHGWSQKGTLSLLR